MSPHGPSSPAAEVNTRIVYTRSSGCIELVNEATGQKLYKIQASRRFVGSVTKVFRYDKATPSIPNAASQSEADGPQETHSSEEAGESPGIPEGAGREGENAVDVGEEALEEHTSLAENEIARLYWKWFASTRMVFEGKIRRRAEYMPYGDRAMMSFVFSHNGVSYRWSLDPGKRRPKLATNDSNKTLIARFYPNNPFKKKSRPCMEVTPIGMSMLDHIIVTYIPVEARRQQM